MVSLFYLSFSWYIQAILNFTRGRTIGLNIDYVMWALVSSIAHGLGVCIAASTDRKIASFDSRSVTIDTKMWFYVINNIVSVTIVALQCWRYDGWNSQRPGALVRGVMILSIIFTFMYVVVNMGIIQDARGAEMAITRYIYACEIFALLCSVVKFIPQIYAISVYGIWIGIDIISLLFELIGAVALFFLIILATLQENNFNVTNSETFRDVINVEIRQIAQSIFIFICISVLYVQLCYYWTMPTVEEMDQKVNERTEKQAGPIRRPSLIGASIPSGVTNRGGHHHRHSTASNGKHIASPNSGTVHHHTHASHDPAQTTFKASKGPIAPQLPIGENTSQADMNRAFGTTGLGANAPPPKWKCPTCTYENEATNIYCAMCETPLEDVLDQIDAEKKDNVANL